MPARILDQHACTHYTTVLRPGTRKKRTVRDPRYRHVVAGLCSGVAYEFRVAGESSLGLGTYSEPSAPFATKAYGANIPDYYDLDKEAPAPAPESEDPLTVAEDLRQLRVCGPDVPRLVLGPSEVARKHAVGESLSLQHAVSAAREAGLVDESFAREASRAKSAVDQLALLEQVKEALDSGNVDPRRIVAGFGCPPAHAAAQCFQIDILFATSRINSGEYCAGIGSVCGAHHLFRQGIGKSSDHHINNALTGIGAHRNRRRCYAIHKRTQWRFDANGIEYSLIVGNIRVQKSLQCKTNCRLRRVKC